MRYRRLEPLGWDLSVLVLGTALYRAAGPDVSFELLDEWRRLGGTVLDTGREYGEAERVIGRWLAARDSREEVVLISKGCDHHDENSEVRRRVSPEDLAADLEGSLHALGTDRVDIFMLHPDDPSQPVGPILEALNEHGRAGRIGAFGASNWTTARLEEARCYAAERGIEGFSCSSVNLSLAAWNAPPWPRSCRRTIPPHSSGTNALSLRSSRGRRRRRASSQAGTTRTSTCCAHSIRRRTASGAGARPSSAIARACPGATSPLAWVLHQPFPAYAIIGPRTPAELLDSVGALGVELTTEEARWLDLEEDGWQSET
jgi:1-deoxyxylulose-5-phosphate synthase